MRRFTVFSRPILLTRLRLPDRACFPVFRLSLFLFTPSVRSRLSSAAAAAYSTETNPSLTLTSLPDHPRYPSWSAAPIENLFRAVCLLAGLGRLPARQPHDYFF